MANFKGFKQVVLADYLSATTEEKKGYIWFVRELSGDTTTSAAVYFGTRKYAEINADGKEAKIIASLGDMVDANGDWKGFLPIDEHEILGDATDATDAFKKIESAVLAVKGRMDSAETRISAAEEAIAGKASQSDLDALAGRVSTAEGDITALTAEVATKADASDVTALEGRVDAAEGNITALTAEVALKANAADVYTTAQTYNRTEIDGKIAGAFKFMGEASAISEDKKIIYKESGDTIIEIVASEENRGHVYQIGEKEYASNGDIWVELGFAIDLSAYAKTADVNTAITAAVSAEESARTAADNVLSGKIDSINETISGLAEDILEIGGHVTSAETEIISLKDRVTTAEGNIDNLDSRATLSADTFAEADVIVSSMTLGQIIYVKEAEVSGRTAGAYIKIGDELRKLDISPGQGDTPLARIEALETKVGSTTIEGTVTQNIANINTILTITGGDVE